MSDLARAFDHGKAFIAFLTCGDPDLETTAAAVRAAAQNGETVGAADWLFLITNYADKRGRYCFRMDEILDPETVSSVSVFGETFSIE